MEDDRLNEQETVPTNKLPSHNHIALSVMLRCVLGVALMPVAFLAVFVRPVRILQGKVEAIAKV